MNKLLIDTNVLIYSKDTSSIFHKASINLLEGKDQLFVASKSLAEYYAVVTRGQTPLLTPSEALNDIHEFVMYFEVLYPSLVSYQKLLELVKIYAPKGLKIHDFEIASIALVNEIDKIATFNRSDFQQIVDLEVIVPIN